MFQNLFVIKYTNMECCYLALLVFYVVAKWMDTRFQPTKLLDSVVIPAKDIRTRCPDAPSDGFVSHGKRERERHNSVGLLLGIRRLPSSSCEGLYIVLGALFLSLMVRRYFMFVMMTFGGSMVIATLLAVVRNRGR